MSYNGSDSPYSRAINGKHRNAVRSNSIATATCVTDIPRYHAKLGMMFLTAQFRQRHRKHPFDFLTINFQQIAAVIVNFSNDWHYCWRSS